MGGYWADEQEGRALKRTAALLCALAALAERASLASGPIRYCVLWILRAALAAAERHVLDTSMGFGVIPEWESEVPLLHGNSGAEAVRLALRFRELASLLDYFRSCICEPFDDGQSPCADRASSPAERMGRTLSGLILAVRPFGLRTRLWPDTS